MRNFFFICLSLLILYPDLTEGQVSVDSFSMYFRNIPTTGDVWSTSSYVNPHVFVNRPNQANIHLKKPTISYKGDTIILVEAPWYYMKILIDSTSSTITYLKYSYGNYSDETLIELSNISLGQNAFGIYRNLYRGDSLASHFIRFHHSDQLSAPGGHYGTRWEVGSTFFDTSEIEIYLSGMLALEISEEDSSPEQLIVYPNPANKLFRIQSLIQSPTDYYIYDRIGRCVKTGRILDFNEAVDVSELIPDYYSLRIENNTVPLIILH